MRNFCFSRGEWKDYVFETPEFKSVITQMILEKALTEPKFSDILLDKTWERLTDEQKEVVVNWIIKPDKPLKKKAIAKSWKKTLKNSKELAIAAIKYSEIENVTKQILFEEVAKMVFEDYRFEDIVDRWLIEDDDYNKIETEFCWRHALERDPKIRKLAIKAKLIHNPKRVKELVASADTDREVLKIEEERELADYLFCYTYVEDINRAIKTRVMMAKRAGISINDL